MRKDDVDVVESQALKGSLGSLNDAISYNFQLAHQQEPREKRRWIYVSIVGLDEGRREQGDALFPRQSTGIWALPLSPEQLCRNDEFVSGEVQFANNSAPDSSQQP